MQAAVNCPPEILGSHDKGGVNAETDALIVALQADGLIVLDDEATQPPLHPPGSDPVTTVSDKDNGL